MLFGIFLVRICLFVGFLNKPNKIRFRVWASRNTTNKFNFTSSQTCKDGAQAPVQASLCGRQTVRTRASTSAPQSGVENASSVGLAFCSSLGGTSSHQRQPENPAESHLGTRRLPSQALRQQQGSPWEPVPPAEGHQGQRQHWGNTACHGQSWSTTCVTATGTM